MIKHANGLIILTLMFGFVFVMFSAFDTVSADSSVIYVNDSGGNDDWDGQYAEWISGLSGPKKSIKNATGTVNEGGTVNIADGNYTGIKNTNIIIDRNMTIKGQSKNGTIVNGNNSGRIFLIQKGINVTIQNLTITNGAATQGGAIYNEKCILAIENCIFINNKATDCSGAIYNYLGTLNIKSSTFIGNCANLAGKGGAICNQGYSTITDNIFNGNTANVGGAIFNYGVLTIVNNTFTNNTATGTDFDNGGGAIFNEATLTINGSAFTVNKANWSGGAIYNKYTCIVNDSSFVNNTAVVYAGAIFNYFSTLNVTNTNCTGNNASSGGAIFNDDGYSAIKGCIFNSNAALNGGGAINNFKDVMTDYQSLTIIDTSFTGNHAGSGGAIENGGYLNITDGTFKNNIAEFEGGAISNFELLNAVNSTFINNTANGNGGAVYNYGNLTVNSSIFTDNIANEFGGAIYNYYGKSTVHFSKIVGNTPHDICRESGLTDVEYNWWGSNDGPSTGRVVGKVVFRWLILTVTANPISISTGGASTITADLLYDNYGNYYDPILGHIPDGILVNFNTSLGTISSPSSTVNGIAESNLNGGSTSGVAKVAVTVDSQTVNRSVYVDVTPPIITPPPVSASPSNGLSNGNIDVILSSESDATIYYRLNGGLWSTFKGNGTVVIIEAGVTTLEFYAKDKDGNPSAHTTYSYTIDKTEPIVTVTPSYVYLSKDSVNVDISTESDAKIYYRLNGGSWSTFTGSGTVVISDNGIADLEVYAVDAAGNPSDHIIYSYTIDKTVPVVTADKTSGISNCNINVALSSESDATIYYRLNNGSWSTFTGRGTVSISNLGTNKLEFYAVDTAGNPSAHTTYTYTIDKTVPVVTATPTSGSSKSISVTLSSESNAKIYYRLNGGSWHTFTGTGKVSITSSGTNKLEFYAVDAAGNPSAHKTYTYTIDKTTPKVAATSPKNNAAGVSRTATISIRLSENILKSSNWSKIYIKNMKTGAKCKITAWISGNHLYIKTNSKRAAYTSYQVYIPASAVKDSAGNNLAASYSFKFKTGK